MKQNIRGPVFETNSSGTHSMVIADGAALVIDVLQPDQNGVVQVHPGNFGWEVESYSDVVSKASYALTYAKGSEREACLAMLRSVILEVTGAKEVKFVEQDDSWHPWGFIDDQNDCAARNQATGQTGSLGSSLHGRRRPVYHVFGCGHQKLCGLIYFYSLPNRQSWN